MGFSVSKQPSYLYQSPSGYIFRMCIPRDLKDLVVNVRSIIFETALFYAKENFPGLASTGLPKAET